MLDPPPPVRYRSPGQEYWDVAAPARPNGRQGVGGGEQPRGRRRFVYPVRRWPRRILIGVNVIVAVMLIAAVAVYGWVNWQLNRIHRTVIPSLAGAGAPPGAPLTVLVVGSDSRSGDVGGDTAQFGSAAQVGGQRSDTIMLVHINPASTTATLLSIPRDLWVQIPGKTTHDRINSTFDSGPDLLIKTIKQELGISVDHYVEVNFQSFRDVVNAVGGVKEYFPTPARDAYSLLRIPAPGCYNLSGDMALSFVRARHYEYQVNGRWVYEAESDLARIKRQQSFIKKTIAKAQSSGFTNPIALNNIVGGVTKNLTLDSGFSNGLLVSLAKRFRGLSPDSLPSVTLPTTQAVIGGADVLLLQQPQAQQTIADFLGSTRSGSSTTGSVPNTTSNVLPSSVRVVVLNGTGRTGEAGKASSDLARQGFTVGPSHSANNFDYATTVIRYLPGEEAKAALVASAVQGASQLQEDSSIQGSDVEVITGQSYSGIAALPGSASASPAPTASPITSAPAAPPTTVYELPGAPAGFVAPPC